jgi:hypothetical protein
MAQLLGVRSLTVLISYNPDTDSPGTGRITTTSITVNTNYYLFGTRERLYISGGFGGYWYTNASANRRSQWNRPGLNLGFGLEFPATRRVEFAFEIFRRHFVRDDSFWNSGIGLNVWLN